METLVRNRLDHGVSRLISIGFTLAGAWYLEDGSLEFRIEAEFDLANVLYAFIRADENAVVYIGKSVNRLSRRMHGYKNPGPTQSTNQKGHANIRSLLEKAVGVNIWALPDNGLLHYGGFHVNLAAGLEDSLVRELSPPWNANGKRFS